MRWCWLSPLMSSSGWISCQLPFLHPHKLVRRCSTGTRCYKQVHTRHYYCTSQIRWRQEDTASCRHKNRHSSGFPHKRLRHYSADRVGYYS
ncbi:hypothetical protein BC830DRAFT_1107751 [Chytriomyces sp. MP71]|nr:hypothetical protein BC830DRAFT_1107751 [Chytriomyces sp. MP71]